MTQNRLQKIIAQAGIASRRKAEELIQEGRVKVNGQVVTELGFKADPSMDRIEVDGKRLEGESLITILMNKPRGVVCTLKDPEGRPTVLDFIKDLDVRLFPVGRLDFATSGALLLTNDGQLSFALTHPSHQVEKIYLVKIEGKVKEEQLKAWREGVDIGDAVTRPAEVFKTEEDDNFTWLQVTLKEGKNRQIRRMAEATGLVVKKLKRLSIAGLTIEGVRVGQYRILTPQEIKKIKEQYNVKASTVRFPKAQRKESPAASVWGKKKDDKKRRPLHVKQDVTKPKTKGSSKTGWSSKAPTGTADPRRTKSVKKDR